MQKIDVHGITQRGEEHDKNHDHFAIATLNKSMRVHQSNLSIDDDSRVHGHNQGHLFLVADGISAAPAPARASGRAVDSVVQYFLNEMPWYHLADGEPAEITLALEDALRNSQDELLRRAAPDKKGMGTTLTMAFVLWPNLYLAHVGDSRCYLMREKTLSQLTTDHTLAAARRQFGGRQSPSGQHVLWNAVGGHESELHPEVRHIELKPGDSLALVTDGVDKVRSTEELRSILSKESEAETQCKRLVETPGSDDSTAIVVRFLPHEPIAQPVDSSLPSPSLLAQSMPSPFDDEAQGSVKVGLLPGQRLPHPIPKLA